MWMTSAHHPPPVEKAGWIHPFFFGAHSPAAIAGHCSISMNMCVECPHKEFRLLYMLRLSASHVPLPYTRAPDTPDALCDHDTSTDLGVDLAKNVDPPLEDLGVHRNPTLLPPRPSRTIKALGLKYYFSHIIVGLTHCMRRVRWKQG